MTISKQPRKQRRARYNAPSHKKRKMMASHLSHELIIEHDVRSLSVIKGDLVRILRGDKETIGKEALVTDIFTDKMKIGLENINIKKADGSELVKKIDPSNVIIVKLNLSDPKRKEKLEKLKGGA